MGKEPQVEELYSKGAFKDFFSKHFNYECVKRTLDVIRLRENAVPTIFKAFPPPLQEYVARTNLKCKSPMERHSLSPDIRFLKAQNNVELDHSYCLSSAQNIKKKLQ
uniref:THAP domain containing, apoptosis associated protein 2 [Xenopus (Silurana) tropicalis] n=1 Tax=Lepeophtheirus salmonis TaxID=72036 RepID=A0A0K2T4B0_LEPSM